MPKYTLHFDGSYREFKKDKLCSAYLIKDEKGKIVFEESIRYNLNYNSTNIAEYIALVLGISQCITMGIKEVDIYGDSQIVIYQLNGLYNIKSKDLKPFYNYCHLLLSQLQYTLNWIKRADNAQADRLTR